LVHIWKVAVPMPEPNAPPVPADKFDGEAGTTALNGNVSTAKTVLPVRSVIFSST